MHNTLAPSVAPQSVSIFPYPLAISYIPLPDNYPQLPENNLATQPLGYTQGDNTTAYVTALIPVMEGSRVIARPTFVFDSVHQLYICTISIEPDVNAIISRLAMFSFSFTYLQTVQFRVELRIQLLNPDGTNELGKVVMDSNMLPSY
jgi:hypothetical protein